MSAEGLIDIDPDAGRPSGPLSGRRTRLFVMAAVPAVLGVLVYARALCAGFYSDDYTWLARLPATLARPSFVFSVFYRDFNPLFHAFLALEYLLGGSAAPLFHATSLLLHGICVALLAILCHRVGGSPWVAAAAAVTWGTNVRLSEAVIWPAAGGHLLATFFVLLAFVCLAGGGRRRFQGATGLFALALLSKETAFFPILVAPLFAMPSPAAPRAGAPAAPGGGPPEGAAPGSWRGRILRWKAFFPLAALGAAFLVFNQLAKPSFHYPENTAADLLLRLPFVLLRPLGLGDHYDFTWPALVLVLAAFGAAAWLLRNTVARAGFLWLVVCLVPILPLYRLSSRYFYLPSIGYALILCGAVGWAAGRIASPGLRRAAALLGVLALALIVAANALSIQREIDDHVLLSRPYADCLAALGDPAAGLRPGETLVIADAGAHDAVPDLARQIGERGNIMKLIPYRPDGVSGLVRLADAINVLRGGAGGWFAVKADPRGEGARRLYVYDGRRAIGVPGPLPQVPDGRLFAARLVPLSDYLAAYNDEPPED